MVDDELMARQRKRTEVVRRYFEACNEASREKFYSVLADNAIHYFPRKVGGPFRGKEAIADLWISFVRDKGSRWTIDRLISDGNEVAVEWTHFKTKIGEIIRGAEWYEFDASDKIVDIRAYYASPRDETVRVNELEGFPYARKGFPGEPPPLER